MITTKYIVWIFLQHWQLSHTLWVWYQSCWQKGDGHISSIRSFDDNHDNLWRNMEDLMIIYEKMLKI